MDTSEYVRFQRPGHRVTGDRSTQQRQQRDGIDFVHAIVDDHTRLAYAEIHPDQKAATAAAFLERALTFYSQHGITTKRLITDNAWTYVRSRAMQQLLTTHDIHHLTTKPYRPRTNGKVERFHQTMAREWAYGLRLPLPPRPCRRPATLAQPLQHNAATQLTRRPTTDQPHSQRP